MKEDGEIKDKIRSLPKDIEAEQMLLGSILINPDLFNQISEFLRPEHFYETIHQDIYLAIKNLSEKGMSADPIKVKAMLQTNKLFHELGGLIYLQKMMTIATLIINSTDYAKIIADLGMKRVLISIGEDIVNNVYHSTLSTLAHEYIEIAESKLFELASEGIGDKDFVQMPIHIGHAITNIHLAMKNSDHITGISSGLKDLDTILSGFHNSDLIIFAARPAMGKTAFGINFALNAWKYLTEKNKKKPEPFSIGFFSLEMSSEQLAIRILSMETKVASDQLRSGRLKEDEYNNIRKKAVELSDLTIFSDESPALSIGAVRSRARRLKRQKNLKLLVIDYLQLMKSNHKNENRVNEISEISQGLKALAKELNIPIIALAQLSRAVELRVDKRPQLSDLRESGSIEQDADVVMFLYREDYYLAASQPIIGTEEHAKWQEKMDKIKDTADIIIAKHRHGATGNVKVSYNSKFSKVTNHYAEQSNYLN